MKVLVFSDVHGNLNCLKSLIETDDWKTADLRVFLGDACVHFSHPNECIELLDKLDCEKLFGNNDQYVCDHVPKANYDLLPKGKLEQLEYMKNIVTEKNRKIALSWKMDFSLTLLDKKFYFIHYAWEHVNNDTSVIPNPKEISLEFRKKMFPGVDADYYFFGHEHKENHLTDGKRHYYSVGPLGLVNPGCYLMIDTSNDEIKIENRYVEVNLQEEIDEMKKAGYQYNKKRFPD